MQLERYEAEIAVEISPQSRYRISGVHVHPTVTKENGVRRFRVQKETEQICVREERENEKALQLRWKRK